MKALRWLVSALLIVAAGAVVTVAVLAGLQACTRATPTPTLSVASPECPTGTPDPRVSELETSIAVLETALPELRSTATALWVPCATATPPFPTPESTPTPAPVTGLCQLCSLGGRECPAGYSCAYCPQLGYRCVRPSSVNGSCNTCRIAGAELEFPALIGLATWYNDSVFVATGERFEPAGLTCAVDVGMWPILAGQTVRVTRMDTGAYLDLAVNDCGYLAAAGAFVFETRNGVARFWPAATGYEVVVDLSPAAAQILSGGETVLVSVEVVR